MKLTKLRPLGFIACAFILTPVCPAASMFTGMHVFGDSLSDTGNASPGAPYFEGRYSNGRIWVEWLATDHLGLAAPLPSGDGGTNYAVGGASSSGALDQIDGFIGGGGTFSATDLVVLWAGANDFLGGVTDPSIPVTNLVNAIQLMAGAGATTILVPNLPDLSDTPQIMLQNDPAASAGAQFLTVNFNTILDAQLELLRTTLVGTELVELDIFTLGKEVTENPSLFGFADATSAALLIPDISNANDYVYFDPIHPTEAMHVIIAERGALALGVPEPSAVVFLVVGVFGIMLPRRRAR